MEIYRLGVFFFKLLTGDLPYKFESEDDEDSQQPPSLSTVLQWILDKDRIPKIPSFIENNIIDQNDPSMKVLMMVMRNCTQYDPDLRPTAYELSKILDSAFIRITNDSQF